MDFLIDFYFNYFTQTHFLPLFYFTNQKKTHKKLKLKKNISAELTANSLMARGSSPGIDNVLMNDFSGLSNSASPIMANGGSSMSDDMSISFQQSLAVPGRSKATPMQIRCKFGSLGASKGQFNSPHGFCLGVDEEIIVADTNNHRIEVKQQQTQFQFPN